MWSYPHKKPPKSSRYFAKRGRAVSVRYNAGGITSLLILCARVRAKTTTRINVYSKTWNEYCQSWNIYCQSWNEYCHGGNIKYVGALFVSFNCATLVLPLAVFFEFLDDGLVYHLAVVHCCLHVLVAEQLLYRRYVYPLHE